VRFARPGHFPSHVGRQRRAAYDEAFSPRARAARARRLTLRQLVDHDSERGDAADHEEQAQRDETASNELQSQRHESPGEQK